VTTEDIRALVENVVLTPNEDGSALVIDLYGDLAGIVAVAEYGEKVARLPRKVRLVADLSGAKHTWSGLADVHRSAPQGAAKSDGGRYRDRTCDPYHVKVVLYR